MHIIYTYTYTYLLLINILKHTYMHKLACKKINTYVIISMSYVTVDCRVKAGYKHCIYIYQNKPIS